MMGVHKWGFTSQMVSSSSHQMALLILLWTVLGGITSDQFLLKYKIKVIQSTVHNMYFMKESAAVTFSFIYRCIFTKKTCLFSDHSSRGCRL